MPNAQEVLEWMAWKDREKELKANMTNEEYIRTCSTEELAKVISDLINEDYWCTEEEALAWLKEKHE